VTSIKDQIAAARALADAATPEKWVVQDASVIKETSTRDWYIPQCEADNAFIAASRTLVPQLADALERACELLEDAADNSLYPGKRAVVRAFLAGEVPRG
jgi:hypothetical protein